MQFSTGSGFANSTAAHLEFHQSKPQPELPRHTCCKLFSRQRAPLCSSALHEVLAAPRPEFRAGNSAVVVLPQRDEFSWTALISHHTKCGQGTEALRIFKEMQDVGVKPSSYTFVAALKACSSIQDLESAREIHATVVEYGLGSVLYVGNMLVAVYAKCESLVDARLVFEAMPRRDVVTWNAMILGYAHMGEGEEALQLYARMQQEGIVPNERTAVGALKACSSLAALGEGNGGDGRSVNQRCLDQIRAIHSYVLRSVSQPHVFVGNILIDAYAKCGSLVDARKVFEKMPHRDVVSWSAIILGYAQMEQGDVALQLYMRMLKEGGSAVPNDRTFVGALKACSSLASAEVGTEADGKRVKEQCLRQVRVIHSDIKKCGSEYALHVGTMLVDVYAKCGSLVDATRVFEKMSQRNVVTWNAIIFGYTQVNESEEALRFYELMQQDGVIPNDRTFVGALKACGNVAGLEKGKEIHAQILRSGLDSISESFLASSLIDMYGKCGSMVDAQKVFDATLTRDVVTWSALISGYSRQGESELVFDLFQRMRQEGIWPDSIIFLSLLTACSHVGLVDKGQKYFDSMRTDYSITATIDHHTCMIDLLGRAGQVDKAMAMVKEMPFQPDAAVWRTLLCACQKWRNVELGRQAFERAVQLDKNDAAAYIFMSNIYAAAHMLEEAQEIQGTRVKAQAWKQPGQSWWTDSRGVVHLFEVGDEDRHENQDIPLNLEDLFFKMKEEEYVCHSSLVWQSYKKGNALCGYSKNDLLQETSAVPGPADWTFSRAENGVGLFGDQLSLERLSQKCLSHPSGCWGCTINKLPLKCSDMHHMTTKEALRVDCFPTPKSVKKAPLEQVNAERSEDGKSSCAEGRNSNARLPKRDEFSWTALITKYTKSGQARQALNMYKEMRECGVKPSSYTFVAALKACSVLRDLESAQEIHAEVVALRLDMDVHVGTMLIDVHVKCGSLVDARRVFEKMPCRNVVSWTAMILGYAQMEEGEVALQLYSQMQQEGVVPNDRTFVGVLKACSSLASTEEGSEADGIVVKKDILEQVRAIHARIIKGGFESDVYVGTMLVDVYVKCGSLVHAMHVFKKMSRRDVVSWTAMIMGYAQMEQGQMALQLYAEMQQDGVAPDARAFVGALKACSSLATLSEGKPVDGKCTKSRCLDQVRAIHSDILKGGSETGVFVGTMLVDVYAKCGSLVDARLVFDKMPHRNVVSWTAMILGYAQTEEGEVALQLYTQMQQEGVSPDARAFVGALKACSSLAGLEKGKEVHAQISKAGLEATDPFVAISLVDMYSKCGSMADAQQVFDALPTKDVVTWSALIAGYARQGESTLVFELFQQMRHDGIQPDSIMFLSVLTVCSHVGLLDKGQMYFEAMTTHFGITPTIDHYTCMADLLGRAGQVDKAISLVKGMPVRPDGAVWRTVLSACRKWKNVELARESFEHAVRLDKNDAAAYVLMSNTYAAAGMRTLAKEVQAARVGTCAWKDPGRSRWTDMAGVVHAFVVGDREHPEIRNIDAKVDELLIKMKGKGYVPNFDSVLRDIPESEKESALCGHSERLAIAYALLKTPEGTAIRVLKNLRVCEDCHTAIGFISKIERRTIICRDASRFHVYKDGKCSCGDYW